MEYKIKPGDSLNAIGQRFGFKDGMPIADHPNNAHLFKNGEHNTYRINSGETLYIPVVAPSCHVTEVNKSIVCRLAPNNGYLRIQPRDVFNSPLDTFKYEVQFGDQIIKGDQSTHGGTIEAEIPRDVTKTPSPLWPNNKSEDEIKAFSDEERAEHNTALLKLFANPQDAEDFQLWNINLNFDAKDGPVGQHQQLANEGKYFGEIGECREDYPSENNGTMMSSGSTLSLYEAEIVTQSGSIPLTSPVNLSPDYYAATWEFLRYGQITSLAEIEYDQLKRELKGVEKGRGDSDGSSAQNTLKTLLLKAKIDVDYYHYCLQQWLIEMSELWEAPNVGVNLGDTAFRKHFQVTVDKHLQELIPQWKQDIEAERSISVLLDLRYDPVDYPPQALKLFSSSYNHQDKLDDLTTHIVSPPMTSRVRFCYNDTPEEVIANSYVIYWRYDKKGQEIETGHEEYYNNASIMMPVGIGRTNDDGYLVQSTPMGGLGWSRSGHFVEPLLRYKDNKFSIYLDPNEYPEDKNPFENKSELFKSRPSIKRMFESIDGNNKSFDELFFRINNHNPDYEVERNFLFGASDDDINNSEGYAELKQSMLDMKRDYPKYYARMRSRTSNHLFNYYSQAQKDTYGFMVFPPSIGLMETEDLVKLGSRNEYVYKGPINSPENQHKPIKLHCTLKEWERRLKACNEPLKKAIDLYYLQTTDHRKNLATIGRMKSLLDLSINNPFEQGGEGDKNIAAEKTKISDALKLFNKGIVDRKINPDPVVDADMDESLTIMKSNKDTIIRLLKSSAFRDELALYREAALNEDSNVSPYISIDNNWHTVYDTIATSLELLGATPWADKVYDGLLQHPLDGLAHSDIVTDMLAENEESVLSELDDNPDTFVVNHCGEEHDETRADLKEVFKHYKKAKKEEEKTSVLDEVFNSETFKLLSETKNGLGEWVNRAPGPSSVLIVVLENYGAFLYHDMLKEGSTRGNHIRVVMAVYNVFGMFSGKKLVSETNILSILRTNTGVRKTAMQKTQEAILQKVEEASSSHGKKLSSLSQRKYLESSISGLASEAAEKNMNILNANKFRASEFDNSNFSDSFYEHADGQNARVYKTLLQLVSVATIVEDMLKASRIQEDKDVDLDVVLATWAKIGSDSAYTAINTTLLINRWVQGESLKDGFLSSSGKFSIDRLEQYAGRLAVGINVITLYLTVRNTFETRDHFQGTEQLDAVLEILGTTLSTIGHVLPRTMGGAFLSQFSLLAWCPGIGQLFMIAGAIIVVSQVVIELYDWVVEQEYIENGPVGYYFWSEYKKVFSRNQSYHDPDYIRGENYPETKGYRALLASYDETSLLGLGKFEWGYLNWRAAVPLYLKWRKRDGSDENLLEVIQKVCRVPHYHIGDRVPDGRNVLVDFEVTYHLLSPEAFLRFYLFLESSVEKAPDIDLRFSKDSSGKTFKEIMIALECGQYIPLGETDEAIRMLKDKTYFTSDVLGINSQGYHEVDNDVSFSFFHGLTHVNTNKPIVWDHPFFKDYKLESIDDVCAK